MKIFANGCSWSWGGGLDYLFRQQKYNFNHEIRKALCWPHQLGLLYKADQVINISEGGGSNQRTLRTTFNYIINQDQSILDETIFIIQMTGWSRFELYYPFDLNNNFENLSNHWVKCLPSQVATETTLEDKFDTSEVAKRAAYRFATSSDIEDIYRNLFYVYSFKGLFDSFNIKNWYMWHNGNMGNFQPTHRREIELKNKLGLGWKTLGEYYYQKLKNTVPNIIDIDDQWEYDRVSPLDPHPDRNGHKQIAQIIYNKIGNKYSNAK